MSWQPPVYDRTKNDVELVASLMAKGYENLTTEEKQKWDAGLKGANNISDWERVEGNIEFLTLEPKQNVPDIITASYYQSVLDRVQAIRDSHTIHQNTPLVPYRPINTYIKMNAIEKILFDVNEILTREWIGVYCGEPITGDEVSL